MRLNLQISLKKHPNNFVTFFFQMCYSKTCQIKALIYDFLKILIAPTTCKKKAETHVYNSSYNSVIFYSCY